MKNAANLLIGAAGFIGSLTLPEIAATLAGFGTFIWMIVQCHLAFKKYQRQGCGRLNCPRRTEQN